MIYLSIYELHKKYNISVHLFHKMSKPGHPNENGAMESINGWIKEEFFVDLKLQSYDNIQEAMDNYIYYFNNIRPSSALNYLTPIEYKKLYYQIKQ